MPGLVPLLGEGSIPFLLKLLREFPAKLGAAKTNANQVTLGLVTVDECLAAVENGEVVDKVHIASLGGDLQLGCLGNRLNGIEGLDLTLRERWQGLGPRVSRVTQQRGSTEVHDKVGIAMENDRAAVETWPA